MRFKILQELQARKTAQTRQDWTTVARASQLPPENNWHIWCIIAGRGFGKTRAGAETVKQYVANGQAKRVALVGNTLEEARKVMLEGDSGLLSIHEPGKIKYYPGTNTVKWTNGAIAQIYSAEAYESLRGPQFDFAWVDELAKFSKARETWDQLMMGLRLGKQPRVIVTTTPRPLPLLEELMQRSDVIVTRGATWENAHDLPKIFLKELRNTYAGTTLGEQELEGRIVRTSSLWRPEILHHWDNELPQMQLVVVGLDPAITCTGDETGIVTVGMDEAQRFFVLDDASGHFSPNAWIQQVRAQYQKHQAHIVVAESNQGGDMITSLLNDLPVKKLRASTSKTARATPIAALYEQGKVLHMRGLERLERQLLEFESAKSPDRVDALAWAITFMQSERIILW